MRPPLLALAWFLAACTPDLEVLRPADPSADGVPGADGPWGVGRVSLRVAVSPTEARATDVFVPLDGDDAPARGRPLVAVIQGGFVRPDRYAWIAEHVATRGFVSTLPRHRLDAALLEPDVDARVRALLMEDPDRRAWLATDAPVVPVGHSLGGVAASVWYVDDPDAVVAIALLASNPAPGTPVEEAPARPALAITGTRDGLISPDEVQVGLERFPGPRELAVVDGMTHFQWTDDPKPGDLRRDGDPGRGVDAVRRDALQALDAFLDAQLLPLADDPEATP